MGLLPHYLPYIRVNLLNFTIFLILNRLTVLLIFKLSPSRLVVTQLSLKRSQHSTLHPNHFSCLPFVSSQHPCFYTCLLKVL